MIFVHFLQVTYALTTTSNKLGLKTRSSIHFGLSLLLLWNDPHLILIIYSIVKKQFSINLQLHFGSLDIKTEWHLWNWQYEIYNPIADRFCIQHIIWNLVNEPVARIGNKVINCLEPFHTSTFVKHYLLVKIARKFEWHPTIEKLV